MLIKFNLYLLLHPFSNQESGIIEKKKKVPKLKINNSSRKFRNLLRAIARMWETREPISHLLTNSVPPASFQKVINIHFRK